MGYSQLFEDSRLKLEVSLECLARVTAEHRGAYGIVGLDGERRVTVSGRLMLNALCREDYLAVGDCEHNTQSARFWLQSYRAITFRLTY